MTMLSSRRQPAEWTPHEAVWIGWPSAEDLWEADLGPARREVAAFVRAVLHPDPDDLEGLRTSGERVHLLARGAEAHAAAELARLKLPFPDLVRIHEAPIGDIWLRDTGPIFVREESGALAATAFRFNGWGGKYELPSDERIADVVARLAHVRLRRFTDFVCEGGAIETDGEGTVITTRQCLLNRNRNPGLSESDAEGLLRIAVGAQKVIWLDEGLTGDHTDGHIDNIARFIAPGRVVCQRPFGDKDPNREVLGRIREGLKRMTDASGRLLEVIEIPSPGLARFSGGPNHPRSDESISEPAPASHMNFYIANHSIVMPTYAGLTGDEISGEEALSILQSAGVRRHVIGVDSSHLLSGGGSFHCISQQQPA